MSNGGFIKKKLKDKNILRKDNNLFNIIKNVDDEYNNLINGKYCNKCGKELLKCKCDDINYIFKETESEENKKIEEDDDDNLDFDINDDINLNKNKKINYFEYDSNKSRGLLVTNKPKLSDYLSYPKSKLVIYNKKQIDEINNNNNNNSKENQGRISNHTFTNINNSNNANRYLNSNQYNASLSGNRYNNRYNNNLTNSNNSSIFINDSNIMNNKTNRSNTNK